MKNTNTVSAKSKSKRSETIHQITSELKEKYGYIYTNNDVAFQIIERAFRDLKWVLMYEDIEVFNKYREEFEDFLPLQTKTTKYWRRLHQARMNIFMPYIKSFIEQNSTKMRN